MQNPSNPNLTMIGTSDVPGGLYNKVKIIGESAVNDDLDCNVFLCTGHSDVHGNITAKSVRVVGTTKIAGITRADVLKISGQMDFDGPVSCREFRCSGVAHLSEPLSGDRVIIRGELTTRGDCEAEQFYANGLFSIDGMLNAGQVNVKLHGGCHAGEIGGERIHVRRSQKWLRKLLMFKVEPAVLEVEVIEGDVIRLENTKAKIIRGNLVTIGSGCEVDLIEYKDELKMSNKAKVKTYKKV